ncbi:MAG: hypothetical protein PF636_07190 [Actinomycetota bacterium]|jgi:hypothetical protein|nr:hypothetical protein [Actinomycetota bacterium]
MGETGQQVSTAGEQFDLKPARARTRQYYQSIVLDVRDGQVTLSGQRLDDAVVRKSRRRGIIILSTIAALVLVSIPGALLAARDELLGGVLIMVAMLLTLALLVFTIVWSIADQRAKRKHTNTRPYSITLPVSSVTNVRVLYDWDLGCALMLLLSVPIGLLITMMRGKKIGRMQAPFDQAAVPDAAWSFKAHTKQEAERLVYLLGPGRVSEVQPSH